MPAGGRARRSPGLECVLWDFGDTLADERWMLEAPAGVPEWPRVWSQVAGGELADAWNRGEIGEREVVAAVAARLPLSESEVVAHCHWCCSRIRFFEMPWAVARRSSLPKALVTVNPDGFSEHVVPRYRLHEVFPVIVSSWQERTLDKGDMALAALERLGGSVLPGEALLIDNKAHNLEAWRSRGGRGYLFRGEEEFRRDLRAELSELASSAGMTPAER
jgi:hypothetical protein